MLCLFKWKFSFFDVKDELIHGIPLNLFFKKNID